MKASLVFLLIACGAMAQQGRQLVHSDGRARRIALVIGNDAYPEKPLLNAVNDARSMKAALEDAGFTVQVLVDGTQQQMEAAIDDFTGSVNPGDIALFFYAGHGVQINDQNYLIPVDFQARTAVDAKYKAYPAQRVQENLEAAGAALQILAVDACRNNPFRSWRGGADGLAAMHAGRGTYIAFATSPGKTASDNGEGKNGLFTGVLVDVLREPGLNIDLVFNRVRDQVYRKSHGQQLPWSTSSVTGEFYFKTLEGTLSMPPHGSIASADLSGERELAFWNSIKDDNHVALLEEYLGAYPTGTFSSIARAKLSRLDAERKTSEARGYWIDPNTKLMWTIRDNAADVDWHWTVAYCLDLKIAGYSGWVLPHLSELQDLRDGTVPKGGIKVTGFVWSDTTTKSEEAWLFNFADAIQYSGLLGGAAGRALCVRRSAAAEEKTTPPHGYWGDPQTKLTWVWWRNERGVSWHEADAYCQSLTIAGHTGWALPHLGELQDLRTREIGDGLEDVQRNEALVWADTMTKRGEAWLFSLVDGYQVSRRFDIKVKIGLCVRHPQD